MQSPLTHTEQTVWDTYAKSYDALRHIKPYHKMHDEITHWLKSKPGEKILDAGCGTGNQIGNIKKTTPEVKLYGIDASPTMLARAEAKVPDAILTHGDLNHDLPYSASFFDQVVCINALYATESPQSVIADFYRILRPGGQVTIENPLPGFENGLVLKAHCNSTKPDSYWFDAHSTAAREEMLLREAIDDPIVFAQMLFVAKHNRSLVQTQSFHFLSEATLIDLLEKQGFIVTRSTKTYADQGILIQANKGEYHD